MLNVIGANLSDELSNAMHHRPSSPYFRVRACRLTPIIILSTVTVTTSNALTFPPIEWGGHCLSPTKQVGDKEWGGGHCLPPTKQVGDKEWGGHCLSPTKQVGDKEWGGPLFAPY